MTGFTFRDLSLVEAEREAVGAAIDHEHALLIALSLLPLDDFRSEQAHDLRRVFYVLAGWHSQGRYDAGTNRERLTEYFDPFYLDDLWCPAGVLPEYTEALCAAIRDSNALLDEAIAVRRRWLDENPLRAHNHPHIQPSAPPAPAKQKGGRFVGGIRL